MKHLEITATEVARYWDRNAALWAEQVRQGRDVCREHYNNPAFLKFIGDLKGKTVLDAGCGEGYNTRILARNGAPIVGVDISQSMIDFARQEEQRAPLGIRYEEASFSDLSLFGDGSFDAVVSFMALMDGPDYEGAVRELFRVLREKGHLFFNITHPCFMTRGYGWIHDENGKPARITASDYFDHQSWVEHWRFSDGPEDVEPFAVPVFPRTLSDYLNTLIEAGFALQRIEEPRPTREACAGHPSLQAWRDHAPLFLYVHAVKP